MRGERAENRLGIQAILGYSLALQSPTLNVSCHLVETRPRQVRVTRVFALSSAQLCTHSTKAHLMRTGLDKMTSKR